MRAKCNDSITPDNESERAPACAHAQQNECQRKSSTFYGRQSNKREAFYFHIHTHTHAHTLIASYTQKQTNNPARMVFIALLFFRRECVRVCVRRKRGLGDMPENSKHISCCVCFFSSPVLCNFPTCETIAIQMEFDANNITQNIQKDFNPQLYWYPVVLNLLCSEQFYYEICRIFFVLFRSSLL